MTEHVTERPRVAHRALLRRVGARGATVIHLSSASPALRALATLIALTLWTTSAVAQTTSQPAEPAAEPAAPAAPAPEPAADPVDPADVPSAVLKEPAALAPTPAPTPDAVLVPRPRPGVGAAPLRAPYAPPWPRVGGALQAPRFEPVHRLTRDEHRSRAALRFELGLGRGWLHGQMAEVFDDAGLSLQTTAGVRVGPLIIDGLLRRQHLDSAAADPVRAISGGVQARYIFALSERLELGLGGALTYAWLSTCPSSTCPHAGEPRFLEHAGAGVDAVVGLTYDLHLHTDALRRGGRFFLSTELRRVHVGLENAPLERTIQGGVTQWTLGVGMDLSFPDAL